MPRPTPLLRLLATAVAAAVGAHLLLHLAPANSPMQRTIVAHSAVAEDGHMRHGAGPVADITTLAGTPTRTGTHAGSGAHAEHRHLMLVLCLAILAAALLSVRAPAARRSAARARAGAAGHGTWTIRLCEPARSPSSVEAGVALLI